MRKFWRRSPVSVKLTPMRKFLRLLPFLLAAFFSCAAAEVNVFAAASLTDALKRIAADYEKVSGDKIIFNFAGAGTLARQINAGAPADIFFSADEEKMDEIAAKHLLLTGSRSNLLGNSLVIVTPRDGVTLRSAADLTNASTRRIALGDVKNVPAGIYAKAYLENLGLWPAIEAKVVPCENVRAVLAAVESGNVDAGIIYKTDAGVSKKVKTAVAVPAEEGPRIVYPVAVLNESPHAGAAGKFLAYLESDAAMATFENFGFIPGKQSSK
jgi:molybdate transport system substrate-binding protein